MKTWLMALTVAALAVATVPQDVQAKRLGSGKSTGMQRDMPARTAPDAPAGKPAPPHKPRHSKPDKALLRPHRVPLPLRPSARGWARWLAWPLAWVSPR